MLSPIDYQLSIEYNRDTQTLATKRRLIRLVGSESDLSRTSWPQQIVWIMGMRMNQWFTNADHKRATRTPLKHAIS